MTTRSDTTPTLVARGQLTALVVDPNLDSRLDAVTAARRCGFEVVGEAAYGTEATFLAADRQPAIILMSLEDPPVRGLATLEALQRQSPEIPVLVYSSCGDPQFLRRAMRSGARDFLTKPLRADELDEAVRSVLEHEASRGTALAGGKVTGTGSIVTVAGAKGGIGKSTLAANLAVSLRSLSGQEVALMDGDVQFGDVAVMFDLEPTIDRCVSFLARDGAEVTREAVTDCLLRHASGVDLLGVFPEPEDWRLVRPDQIARLAATLAETHEVVVVDTPGTINELVAVTMRAADIVLLVTSLEMSSIKDTKTAARILDSLEVDRARVRLIINDSTAAPTVTAQDVAEATGLQIAAVIPHDKQLGRSVQRGVPIVIERPTGKYARAVSDVAGAITGVRVQAGGRSPFGRLSSMQIRRGAS